MTKQEHIDYWVKTAAKDWAATSDLYKAKHYIQSLFWSHLVLEKLLKAHWVKDNEGNTPPKIHNLVYLLHKTKLALEDTDVIFLDKMNDFQLEGRYPDYVKKIYKIYKQKETSLILKETGRIRKCLLKNLR